MKGRIGIGEFIALLAAAALMFSTAMDWYSTKAGDAARDIERSAESDAGGARSGQIRREVREDARRTAEAAERNAWQVDGTIDRAILALLLAAAVFTFATVLLSSGGRDDLAPRTGVLAVGATMAGALLLSYRLLQEPGLDSLTTVKAGAPLALVSLGLIALGLSLGMRSPSPGAGEEPPEAQPSP